MSVDRVEFDRLPPEPELSIWRHWMRQHGVDPSDVAVPGWIERHPDTCRLVYGSYERDERGLPRWDRACDDAVRVTRVFQMEAPPLPFPMEGPVTEAECPLTELPPSQCACPTHRGGAAPGEEEVETVGPAFEAAYDGRCERSDDPIRVGQMIARVADGSGYVHAERCPR